MIDHRKLILSIGAFAVSTLLLAACGGDDAGDPAGAGQLTVVATTTQIEALAREVAGDNVTLVGIIPAGADAHEFEPTASDLVAIEGADLILRHGLGLDEWLDDTLSAAQDATTVQVTKGIELEEPALEHGHDDEEEEHDEAEGEEGHDEDGLDPHVWQDPARAALMVENIAAALSAADAEHTEAFTANALAYTAKLDETATQIQAIIDEIPEGDRKLVTNHDAFGYFARAFGLEIVGAVIPSTTTNAEPSAEDTAALLDLIEDEGVKAIFAESSVNAGLADTLANDAGVAIVDDLYGDSLGAPGSGAETVDGMLLANARTIADALK